MRLDILAIWHTLRRTLAPLFNVLAPNLEQACASRNCLIFGQFFRASLAAKKRRLSPTLVTLPARLADAAWPNDAIHCASWSALHASEGLRTL